MNPHRISSKVITRTKDVNWSELWNQLRATYILADKHRQVAVLDNFKDNKEVICRRLGVVSGMDIIRISNKLKSNKNW